jgi:hypothetical protein
MISVRYTYRSPAGRSVEANVTAGFAFGPAGALVGFIAGLGLGGARRRTRK